jgi:hypothetical protein
LPAARTRDGIAFDQLVIPVQAGIHSIKALLDARFRGHDSRERSGWFVASGIKATTQEVSAGAFKEGGMVKSVVLAWGSSVWDPRDLQIASKFAPNGPLLPIEFCRVSEDGRLTLAIDETFGALCKTYSAPSALEGLDAARDNLCLSEGLADARAIGFVEPASGRQSDLATQSHPQVVATIGAWAESLGYDAAIWTALTSNFDDWGKGGEPFSVSAALQYLETLEGEDTAKFAHALAYIRKAPPEVETPVREEVAKRWPV